MTEQLSFAGNGFRIQPPRIQSTEPVHSPESDARKAAHLAVEAAEWALIGEEGRMPSREHWMRLAGLLERRATAWMALADVTERDAYGHASRAMKLAANADTAQARMLRTRLRVQG